MLSLKNLFIILGLFLATDAMHSVGPDTGTYIGTYVLYCAVYVTVLFHVMLEHAGCLQREFFVG